MFDKPPDSLLPTSRHAAVAGWFFGPKAENFDYLQERISKLMEEQHEYRSDLYEDDPPFITDGMKRTELYRRQLEKLNHELDTIGKWLRDHSVPFFSPRYNAHMSMETSMPSLIGFITGLFENQNNVALEASPVTSIIEGDVGKQLCCMLGYRTPPDTHAHVPPPCESESDAPVGWGHITCDGSVANLEAIWALRNLKFYPLSLNLAITEGDLGFLKDVAVYGVVAIIGSTEHGAIDPLHHILNLREKFEKQGMSFGVHCDAAWGGYFASILRTRQVYSTYTGNPAYVPRMCMSDYTVCQLDKLQQADSITVDPHKSGYCPYPAGGLCYRDGKMRYLVTWTSPVVYRSIDQEDSIGVYGVEGSKPGAAAVGVYISHNVLGLDKEGYGQLLSEAIFTSKRFYCQWAAMKTRQIPIEFKNGDEVFKTVKAKLRVRPFNMLPTEKDGSCSEDIEEQKRFIRKHILKRSNQQVMKNPRARELLQKLGADVTIHTFACNFEVDGKVNEDINEANYLNSRIYQKLSLSSIPDNQDTSKIPLFLTSTQMSQASYGRSLDQFKRRLGLKGSGDLYVLINVTMSPWPSAYNFVEHLAEKFRDQAEKDMEAAVRRNVAFPDLHGFIIQGYRGDRICGVHLPMFNMQNHRKQLVVSCKLPREVHDKLIGYKESDPNMYFTFGNQDPEILSDFISRGSFKGVVQRGIPGMPGYDQIATDVQISDVTVHLDRSLEAKRQSPKYPAKMPFFIYSAQDRSGDAAIYNMDHILTRGPNTQLTSEMVEITGELEDVKSFIRNGCWIVLPNVDERTMQPLLPKDDTVKTSFKYTKNFPFAPGQTFEFLAFETEGDALNYDPTTQDTPDPIFRGEVKLGPCFANYDMLNADGGSDAATEDPSELAHPAGNVSSLMADHPVPSSMVELKDRHQCQKIDTLKQRLNKTRRQQARAIIPQWVSNLTDLGAEE
ncbi:PLP-dependent transferase [Aspergillus steynii IBT 23096]|uniref:PLP-dependent transferase n=1 Tax=Aspergillus steynii IBT 23096 TaxID=1392250 RepID=A0A2I2G6J7_9EURO|nr:PLP-dependent transferase [Aspergillus steynii IBT 23096]PLB48502.1 PLP-dependent transferase [Aspergillus steynii IBT 23096]